MPPPETPALAALSHGGLDHQIVVTPPARSAEESAELQGVAVEQLLKTMVVRRGEDDYVFVLVPGPRQIDWAKLRKHLGVSRLSMPPRDEAVAATGYEPGTITPLGSTNAWPVIMDESAAHTGTVTIGGGERGVNVHADALELLRFLDGESADVTKLSP
ncbi:MAG: Cys-tRNA(Pro)/Cys-tRNA(Cys) deacylase [Actinomycetota bacterium]|nr:Cys-tRNA(Pro)/Cys-tRNA(Cys) deacylase [Actinomycetota bacterium]